MISTENLGMYSSQGQSTLPFTKLCNQLSHETL